MEVEKDITRNPDQSSQGKVIWLCLFLSVRVSLTSGNRMKIVSLDIHDFDKKEQISKQASNFDPAAFTRLPLIRQNHALAKRVIREGRVLDPVSRVMHCFQSPFFVPRKGRL